MGASNPHPHQPSETQIDRSLSLHGARIITPVRPFCGSTPSNTPLSTPRGHTDIHTHHHTHPIA